MGQKSERALKLSGSLRLLEQPPDVDVHTLPVPMSFRNWQDERDRAGTFDTYEDYLERFEDDFFGKCKAVILKQPAAKRLQKFGQLRSYRILSARTYWQLLRTIWLSQTIISPFSKLYREFFVSRIDTRKEIMSQGEIERLDSLSESFLVYRGCRGHKPEGLSWTLDYNVAKSFAIRAMGENYFKPGLSRSHAVFTGTVRKCDVIALIDARRESEIIALRRSVKIVARETVSPSSGKIKTTFK